jgi:hypothetical protein
LIGPKGAHVIEIGQRNDVNIQVPRSESKSETITITGYEQKCVECADEIRKTVDEWESMVSFEARFVLFIILIKQLLRSLFQVNLDVRFHPRLIGQRGKNLRKVLY